MAGKDANEDLKKKRRPRACDHCRRRKVRCDGSEEEGRACSLCVETKRQCTYVLGREGKRKTHLEPQYVQALEIEITRLRQIVQQLQEKVRFYEKQNAHAALGTMTSSIVRASPKNESPASSSSGGTYDDAQVTDDDENLVEGFKCMCLGEKHLRFLGRSSSFPLMKAAIDMKKELGHSDYDWPTVSGYAAKSLAFRRPEFWMCITDIVPPAPPYTDFPEPALMEDLLTHYFNNIHHNFPLLHRPTFLQGVTSGLHLVDEGFGATLLLVCALASRFSNNPAVLPPGNPSWQWAGWQWFEQVHAARRLIPLAATTLYDLQVATLAAGYTGTSAIPHSKYAIVGHGVRLAQDLGAHRRMSYGTTPTVEGELRKRAFWMLVLMDQGMSSVLGRPCGSSKEDFDVDYPLECDDDYWVTEDPQDAFKQPPGKPSTVAYFNCVIRLEQIHANALRTLYSLQGAKTLHDPERAQQIVADLDSELNEWIDSIPEHLKYDPQREPSVFASQSAGLHASWYSLRVFIHRPFITAQKPLAVPFPSRAICTNAARSCIQVLDRQFVRAGSGLVHQEHQLSLFSASVVLLLHVYNSRRDGQVVDAQKEFEHVYKTLRILKASESRWYSAGRFWDVLSDLLSAMDPTYRPSAHCAPPAAPEQTPPLQEYTSGTTMAPPADLPLEPFSNISTFGGVDIWQAPELQAQVAQPLEESMFAADPDLERIFEEFFPAATSREDPFAPIPQGFPTAHHAFGTGTAVASAAFAGPEQIAGYATSHGVVTNGFGTGTPAMWASGSGG
ncbi:Zn(II)2Cys6 transcription factor [Phanerochaete sordida]|uniref:Zn(II)2Cys6 transcription factor n=1 Tax=Phanerochaete sordida TaxID=48140 RepID=A0A9P3G7L2_9APHY|nr:Zn(II)2Cys6 transcription factor [Phanerochaete sordida]